MGSRAAVLESDPCEFLFSFLLANNRLLIIFSACVTSGIRLKYFMSFGKSFDPTCKSDPHPFFSGLD